MFFSHLKMLSFCLVSVPGRCTYRRSCRCLDRRATRWGASDRASGHPVPVHKRICKSLRSPGINSEEAISPTYAAWQADTTNRLVISARQAGNRFLGSIKGLQIQALSTQPFHRYKSKVIFVLLFYCVYSFRIPLSTQVLEF
jgi:hypothetical protein